MKKLILICACLTLGACADTYEHRADYRTANYTYAQTTGCNSCAQPYAVKIGTEVIDHYQTYEPVTTYRPAGTFSTRRTCGARPCGN